MPTNEFSEFARACMSSPFEKGDRGGFVFRLIPYCEFTNRILQSRATLTLPRKPPESAP